MFKGVSYRIYLININSINRTKLWKTMKIKIYKTIEDRIKKIENDSFNEDDIKAIRAVEDPQKSMKYKNARQTFLFSRKNDLMPL